MSDFFRYMMGRDGMNGMSGLSAYGLWVRDVTDEDGLENPHDPDTLWPRDQTLIYDFWRYLRGEDGKDGTDGVAPPAPGEAGSVPAKVSGKANVIAICRDPAHSEYVDPATGSVTYNVYDDAGLSVPAGVTVKGLPGIPDEVFTTVEGGQFPVPADKLPTSGTNTERFGSCLVTYTNSQGVLKTDETSARNTYVPQRVDVRLRVTKDITTNNSVNNATLGGAAYLGVTVVVERRVSDDAQWETIPVWLEAEKTFYAYELTDHEDPESFDYNGTPWNRSAFSTSITSEYQKRVERPTKPWAAMSEERQKAEYHYWDGKVHYVNIVMEEYYGVRAHASAVIEVPPVQFHPMPKDVTLYAYNSTGNNFGRIEGTFDMAGVDRSLLYDTNMGHSEKTVDGKTFTYYYPTINTTESSINNAKSFTLLFRRTSGGSTDETSNATATTLGTPNYAWGGGSLPIYVGSDVYLMASGRFFVSPGNATPVGVLAGDVVSGFRIDPEENFVFPSIPVTHVATMP
jgi:hypothetical protein